MISYLFRLHTGIPLEDAEDELLSSGLLDLYAIEEPSTGETLIGGRFPKNFPTHLLKSCTLTESIEAPTVNWQEQWAQFAEDFHDGKAHIDLTRFGRNHTLLLLPGPGFGDLSHPTTYLMLELMKNRAENRSVIDIGCGSGILTLAALLFGAKSAIGIDIDPLAIEHAKNNATLNQLPALFSLTMPNNLPASNILLVNMILPEQCIVMKDLLRLNALADIWITSGILIDQRKEYLELTSFWGWRLLEETKQDEWLAFVFSM